MNTFRTLFKYELKKQFPIGFKKEKKDIVGSILSFLVTALIIGMFVYFLAIISKNYIAIKIDKVYDPKSRAYELLNLFYLVILIVMFFLSLENMRKTLVDKTDKNILLKLPVKEQTLFLSKLSVLLLKNYIMAFLLVVPTNIIIYLALMPSAIFFLNTFIVWLIFPILVFLFTSIFIVPYIMLMNFIRNKYLVIFILLTLILIGFVLIYISFLKVVQGYLETGFIKFLFNAEFIETLQSLLLFTYPVNCLSGIMVGKDLLKSILVVCLCTVLAGVLVYFVTKKLYHITLYKSENIKSYKRSSKIKKHSPLISLIRKEFISISREPKHIFSYLVIATTMPILVFCCYTLFESLITNMLGIKIPFALALFIVVMFSVLTNTFCATNVTREGTTLLKQKTFPIKASQILTAKVLFCLLISLLSVFVSVLVLIVATSLSIWSGILCLIIGSMFTVSQILVATRLDLKNTKMSFTFQQIEKHSSTTIAKVVSLGLVISIVTGLMSLIVSIVSEGALLSSIKIHPCFIYLIPLGIGVLYLGLSILFYYYKLQRALDNISK